MRSYRGRYVIVVLLFLLELPVFASLALGAAVTRLIAAVATAARRVVSRPST